MEQQLIKQLVIKRLVIRRLIKLIKLGLIQQQQLIFQLVDGRLIFQLVNIQLFLRLFQLGHSQHIYQYRYMGGFQ
jgi:hypothetical protein